MKTQNIIYNTFKKIKKCDLNNFDFKKSFNENKCEEIKIKLKPSNIGLIHKSNFIIDIIYIWLVDMNKISDLDLYKNSDNRSRRINYSNKKYTFKFTNNNFIYNIRNYRLICLFQKQNLYNILNEYGEYSNYG